MCVFGGCWGASAGASAEKQTADSEPRGTPEYFVQTGCDLAEEGGMRPSSESSAWTPGGA